MGKSNRELKSAVVKRLEALEATQDVQEYLRLKGLVEMYEQHNENARIKRNEGTEKSSTPSYRKCVIEALRAIYDKKNSPVSIQEVATWIKDKYGIESSSPAAVLGQLAAQENPKVKSSGVKGEGLYIPL